MRAPSTFIRLFLVLGLLIPVSKAPVQAATPFDPSVPDGWISLAQGIEYKVFHLVDPRPINLFVARLERANLAVTLDSGIAQGRLTDGRETVRDMAARYDQTINFWGQTWGNRNRVVVAINGYFFRLNSGTPWSGQIHSGWYAQRFTDFLGDAGFAWGMNRTAFIGDCVYHSPKEQFITYLKSGDIQKIYGINAPRDGNDLVLYTPQYDVTTNTDNTGLEILLEMSRPSLVLPGPAQAVGVVREIRDRRSSTPIPFDHVVLSATGLIRSKMLNRVAMGDQIGISQEITDCAASTPKYWTKTYASIGGDYHFLSGGVVQTDFDNSDAGVPNSRTAIAFNQHYVYYIVVDGWNRGVSEGMKIFELASFTRDTLLATDAVSLDSGGSSTMVVNGQVINNTYCNFTRECGMQPQGASSPSSVQLRAVPDVSNGQPGERSVEMLQPLVGNSMMMVVVEPMSQSRAFLDNQAVITTGWADLRLGPGTNFPALMPLPPGSPGRIVTPYYNNLNGVLAKGSYWWKIDFGSEVGWVEEAALWAETPFGYTSFLPLVSR